MKRVRYCRTLIPAVIGLVLCGCGELGAQDVYVCRIIGRVVAVQQGGQSIMVNRGSAVNIVSDSLCWVRPARATEPASTRLRAAAIIADVYIDSARVIPDGGSDAVKTGDRCELYAYIPLTVAECPVGRVAMYDIVLVDFEEERPLYTLAELVRAPRPETFDAIVRRFLNELYDQSEMGEYEGGTIQTGFFAGMTMPEAFASVDTYKLERFFEYLAQEQGTYSGRDWIFIEVFRAWVQAGTPVTAVDRRR